MQVIHRLQDEFDPQTVYDILSMLASARRGLSDSELLDLTEGNSVAITDSSSDLFPILRQLRPYLQHRGERWDFFHRNLYKAVNEQFLPDHAACIAAHARLADYFADQDYFLESLKEQRVRAKRHPRTPRPTNVRKLDELPWQLLQAAKKSSEDDATSSHWDIVADLLTDMSFLEAGAEAGMLFELVRGYTEACDAMPTEHPRRRFLMLLDEAIRRDVYFMDRHSTEVFQCLWNSCWWYDCPKAAGHYQRTQIRLDGASALGLCRPETV